MINFYLKRIAFTGSILETKKDGIIITIKVITSVPIFNIKMGNNSSFIGATET
jgi:hypothetical protein